MHVLHVWPFQVNSALEQAIKKAGNRHVDPHDLSPLPSTVSRSLIAVGSLEREEYGDPHKHSGQFWNQIARATVSTEHVHLQAKALSVTADIYLWHSLRGNAQKEAS